jgi:hypothetical protein
MTEDHDNAGHGPVDGAEEHFDRIADEINREGDLLRKRDGTPASPTYRADNSGGFGNPPIGGQFGPGNKGGGRKRKDKSMEAALRREFTSKVAINRNGKIAKVELVEVLARRKRDIALKGTGRELDAAIELARKYGPAEGAEKPIDFDGLTADELDILVPFMSKLIAASGGAADRIEAKQGLRGREGLYRLSAGPDGLPEFKRVGD